MIYMDNGIYTDNIKREKLLRMQAVEIWSPWRRK